MADLNDGAASAALTPLAALSQVRQLLADRCHAADCESSRLRNSSGCEAAWLDTANTQVFIAEQDLRRSMLGVNPVCDADALALLVSVSLELPETASEPEPIDGKTAGRLAVAIENLLAFYAARDGLDGITMDDREAIEVCTKRAARRTIDGRGDA